MLCCTLDAAVGILPEVTDIIVSFSATNSASDTGWPSLMNSNQAKRFLASKGCTFETTRGGHLIVRLKDRKTILPMHGGTKQLKTGTWLRIVRDLDLKE